MGAANNRPHPCNKSHLEKANRLLKLDVGL